MAEHVAKWVRLARGDISALRSLLDDELIQHAAFWAQQAAEKAFKAALVDAGLQPPRIHDLRELSLLLPAGMDRPLDDALVLGELSDWATSTRYDEMAVLPAPAEVEAVATAVEAYLARRGW